MVQTRTRRIVNPGRKKRKISSGKKKMSAKQIKYFGTARQRAALKKRKRVTNAGKYSVRKFKKAAGKYSGTKINRLAGYKGPVKSLKKSLGRRKSRKGRTRNIGEIVSISLAGLNPGKKRGSSMAKRRRRNSAIKVTHRRRRRTVNPAVRRTRRRRTRAVGTRRRRRNPTTIVRRYSKRRMNAGGRRRRHYGRRRNSGFSLGSTTGLVEQSLGVIAGAVASKYVTQLALGGNNTGWMGYLGNAVASLALGFAVGKVSKRPQVGAAVTLGGFVALTLRLLQDFTPIGQYVNLSLNGAGKGGDIGIGIIQDSSFPLPQTFAPGSMTNAIVPVATRNYVSSQMAQAAQIASAAPKSGMGFAGRRVRRAVL